MHRQLGDGAIAPDCRHRHLRLERRAVLFPCPLHVLLPRYRRFLGAGLNLHHLSHFRGPAQSRIRSMMRFGGSLTVTGILVYIGCNAEKVLIGRFWGADAIGIYGRGYQLVNIPTDNLNSAVGEVAFSALSRLQHDLSRFKSYFLKGYSLVLGLTLPITVACAIFANDFVLVLLGPKWMEAAPIFR